MPKDFYDKLTAISDATSKNKAILILILTMLGSGITNTIQYFKGIEDTFMNKAMTEQITILATQYVKPLSVCKK